MAILVNSQTVIFNDRTLRVSSGATRPASPVTGMFWYNTSLAQLEVWNGTAWKAQNVAGGAKQNAYAWGGNSRGQLGTDNTNNTLSPVSVVGGFTDWVQIGAGVNFTVALRANGTAWCWGEGSAGKLGDNTIVSKSSPVSVVGGFTDWIQIANGGDHTAALRANGTAWGWGTGNNGRLGTGNTTARSSPVSVVGGFTDWIQISAGRSHTAALRANGTAWCWGINTWGFLGDGTTTSRTSPVSVIGGFTDWVQIAGGINHTVAIRANGTAWGWGNNVQGQLGDNTVINKSSPVLVVGGFTDWVQVATGFGAAGHTVAIRANGTAWAWGYNSYGRLGDGTTTSRSSPVSVIGGFTDWVQVSCGEAHSLAIRANGTAWGWGNTGSGVLGSGNIPATSSPVSVFGGFTDWVQVDAGSTHTAAIRG